MLLSLSRDLNLVQKKIPAAENPHSASTEIGGIVSSQLLSTVCRFLPWVPELMNSAISALMAAMSFFPALYSAAALLVDGVGDGSILDCRMTAAIFSFNVCSTTSGTSGTATAFTISISDLKSTTIAGLFANKRIIKLFIYFNN